MFIRSNNWIHPHFHTTDDISSLILRAPAGGYCTELVNRCLCFIRRGFEIVFDTLLFRCYSWNVVTHLNIRIGCATQAFGLFIFPRIVCLFLLFICFYLFVFFFSVCFFFCMCFLFVLFEFLLFFHFSRGLLYIIVFAYNVYRKMKFNARIDKLNMNLHAFNRLMNC